jgi:hypothetical protein
MLKSTWGDNVKMDLNESLWKFVDWIYGKESSGSKIKVGSVLPNRTTITISNMILHREVRIIG